MLDDLVIHYSSVIFHNYCQWHHYCLSFLLQSFTKIRIMGLSKYKEKRNFKETPEPQGGKSEGGKLRFVVQKHDASHLHYDFRLEMEGVLKSWAVPKGPSMDPKVKRLAMMVEDHPYDYRNFEGIIPSGYGAGTVIVWDEGTYESMETDNLEKNAQDKDLRHQLHAGKIKFVLNGKKLKGEFALVRAHGRGENGWLLMKLEDEFATETDILKKDKSVLSDMTLSQVEKTTDIFYGKNPGNKGEQQEAEKAVKKAAEKSKTAAASKKTAKEKSAEEKPAAAKSKSAPKKIKLSAKSKKLLEKAPEKRFASKLSPMLTTLVDKPFDRDGWIYEVKWDGYRTVAFLHKDEAELKSRNDKSFNEKFYPVYEAVKNWGIDAIVDGEIVVAGENGISNFGKLQNWRSEADGELLFYVFDLLWLDGKDLTHLTLMERKAILAELVPEEGIIRLSDVFEGSGTEFFDAAKELGLEGIIAKKADSLYYPGTRGDDWLKIKSNKRQEMVIGGFTRNEGSSKIFSALLVGVFESGKFIYTGKVGTGFSQKLQKEMMEQFEPLITKKVPFDETPDVNKPSRFRPDPPHASATWLKPELVCEVSFAEMTTDGVMRHPSFEGMRTDKKAKDVVRESEKSTEKVIQKKKNMAEKLVKPTAKSERKTLLNPTDETQVRKINGNELKFTNLSKFYWPDDKVTKRDLLNYYYQAAPFILPYLKDRPQSLLRHPNGIEGHAFFQKDVTDTAPDWVETYLYHSDADQEDKHYLVATNEASLLYMASLGCIEMNPWNSTIKKPDNPTWCIIDLDPSKKTTFEQVIKAAQVTKDVLDELGVEAYCKTSGSTGIHIYIPLGAKYDYELSKEFARLVVTLVHQQIPEFTSLERSIKDRKGKMYLDFLQNRAHATVSAPYSLRPKPYATVSMPLHWDEVKKGLKMTDFTIHNAIERMRSEGDIFKPVLGKGIDLEKILNDYEKSGK